MNCFGEFEFEIGWNNSYLRTNLISELFILQPCVVLPSSISKTTALMCGGVTRFTLHTTNVSIPLGSWLCDVVFGGLTSTLRCFRSVYGFQGIMSTYTLVLHVRKSLYACCFVQWTVGTWILIPFWRSIHSSYINPNCSLQMFTLHIFCNLVSHPCAGSLGCMLWLVNFYNDRSGMVHLIYMMYSHLGCIYIRFNVPLIFASFLFY